MSNASKKNPIIEFALKSFVDSDVGEWDNLLTALEKVYVFRALDVDVSVSDSESASKLIRIAIPLESHFHHMRDENNEELLRAYNLIASIFEYAARIYSNDVSVNNDFWLRASISYLCAKKSANSIVCAEKAKTAFINKNDLESELNFLVFSYLSRKITDTIELSNNLIVKLEKKITDQEISDVGNQFFVLGALEFVKSINSVANFLKFGSNEDYEKWQNYMETSLKHFDTSGNEFFIWLTSRLLRSTNYLLENSLWSLTSLIPNEIIRIFTQNKKYPIYDLWDGQIDALKNMIAKNSKNHQALIMPTSSGKTLVATILAAKELLENKGNCFYVTPFKALVSEVSEFMNRYLPQLGIKIRHLPGKYDVIPNLETMIQENARLFVLTPEKLDLLWRLNDSRIKNTRLFIFDEVQNVTSEGRGLLLELLISKIKEKFGYFSRIFLLSAVVPENSLIRLVEWLGNKNTFGKKIDWSPTRGLNAIFFRNPENDFRSGLYYDNKFTLFDILPADSDAKRRTDTVQLTLKYLKHLAPVLVYCGSKAETENMVDAIYQNVPPIEFDQELQNVSEYIETIMGKESILSKMIKSGIAYHHASLPNSIKYKIEQLGKTGKLRVICCTSTLIEGVNLYVRTVIINNVYQGSVSMQGLQLRNLSGRAGRALRDTEGHTVLMESSFNQILTNENYTIFQSRFFQYIQGLTSDPEYVKAVTVIESDLLARFYSNDINKENFEERSSKILQSTLFSKQSSTSEFMSALSKLRFSAKNIVSIPNLTGIQLQVFAETGLGIKECKFLDENSHMFNKENLIFRNNGNLNWPQIIDVVKASLLPNSQFSSRILTHIPDKINIIQNWLIGKPIYEIAKEIENPPSRKTLNNVTSFLYGYVADEISWTNAGLIRLIDSHQSKDHPNLDYEFQLLPSYLKYGVNNAGALLLCLAGLEDREIANDISTTSPLINDKGSNWNEVINWMLNLPNTEYGSLQKNLLDNLSQLTIQIDNFEGINGPCEIDVEGNLVQDHKKVAKLDVITSRIFKLLQDRHFLTKNIEKSNDKTILRINYS